MRNGIRVEYQTGIAEFGIGDVVDFDPATEIVKVIDVDDGSQWAGPVDLANPVGESQDSTDFPASNLLPKE